MRRNPQIVLILLLSMVSILSLNGCKGKTPKDKPHWNGEYIEVEPTDDAAYEAFPPAYRNHFHAIDGKVNKDGKYEPLDLNELEIKGRNAWMLWTGGNEIFWDWLSRNGYGSIDLLKVIDSDRVKGRFARSGLIPEPNMRPPTAEETKESHGIRFARPVKGKGDYDSKYSNDENKKNNEYGKPKEYSGDYASDGYSAGAPDPNVYGYPTGIVGMRIFKNPEFETSKSAQRKWKRGFRKDGTHRFYSEADEDKAWASNPSTVKPYVVGVSCAICHASYHPLNPPLDVDNPKWENISSTIGAQYLRIREIFGNTLDPDNYVYHVIDSQLPGTIDTSLVASDHLNNPNTMNAIFGLGARVTRALYNAPEKMSEASYGPPEDRYPGVWDQSYVYADNYYYPPSIKDYIGEFEGNPRYVPRVLLDGSDSVGTWIALARVYLNIGTYHQQWSRTHNTVLGGKAQTPFTLKDCEENSVYWHATKIRVDPMTAYFLKSTDPMLLKDAIVNNKKVEKFPETKAQKKFFSDEKNKDLKFTGLSSDPSLKAAREVFAKGCIACHSSKQPDFKGFEVRNEDGELLRPNTLDLDDLWQLTRGNGELPEEYAEWARHAVELPSFWENNYLSTDMRIPVNMLGTNSARAMATNAKTGHVWDDFASLTFKDLPAVKDIRYPDPFSGATKSYDGSSGGPGYYRVPSLTSMWATAPFLHNNALGKFNNDPSVHGRLEAFDDAIQKFLWPKKRLESPHDLAKLDAQLVRSAEDIQKDQGLVWRTSRRTHFKIRGHQIPPLIRGFTGWTDFWVGLVPWVPAILCLGVGLVILFSNNLKEFIKKQVKWLLPILRWIRDFVNKYRHPVAIGLTIAWIVVGWIWLKYFPFLRLLEAGSDWSLPWINLQIVFLLAISALTIFWFVYPRIFSFRWTGGVFVATAILLALGFGRFAAGQGGDIAVGPFPKGMPVNLIINLDTHAPPKKTLKAVTALTNHFVKHAHNNDEDAVLLDFEENVAPLLQEVSNCPDLVMDRGHDFQFVQRLTDDEKLELIQLLKTF